MNGKAILAVDFGNQNIRCAGLDALGNPRIITNKEKEDFTPCCLLFDGNGFVIGRTAMSERLLRPNDVVMGFKPKMGTDDVVFERDGKQWRARDLYAEVLRHIKEWAERQVGLPIEDVVVTVPEQWGTRERLDVEKAAKMAGLHVKDMPSEPVAAAVGYGMAKPGSTIIVFDAGSSTTDVCVMKIEGEKKTPFYKGLATAGDLVAGRDIDGAIQTDMLTKLENEGITPDPDDATFSHIIAERAQHLKETLSDIESKSTLIECQGKRITYTLTRAELEALAAGPISRMMGLCDKALEAANLSWQEITDIVPVGGAVRMPALIDGLKKFGPPVRQNVDPDRATVYGAAKIGGAAGGRSIEGKLLPPTGTTVTEVVAKDLSVLAVDGRTGGQHAVVLVPANSAIPVSGEDRFDFAEPEQQTGADIVVVEGKHGAPPNECRILDKFDIQGLPVDPKAAGGRIAIKFAIDRKGITDVTVYDKVSGQEFKRTFQYA